MDKRTFLKTSALLTATALWTPDSLLATETQVVSPFTLPKLAYNYADLEPHIDAMTMEIHHSKHHQTYITKLNEAIKDTKYEKESIEKILAMVDVKESAIRNNAGGHYNHSLFWKLLTPKSMAPTGKLLASMQSTYTNLDNFKELFGKEALARFGSGWVWLLIDQQQNLSIVSTPNQDNPLMTTIYKEFVGKKPLLCLDVWEHAYYLKYQNKRADYIKAFWNLVNWEEVAKNM